MMLNGEGKGRLYLTFSSSLLSLPFPPSSFQWKGHWHGPWLSLQALDLLALVTNEESIEVKNSETKASLDEGAKDPYPGQQLSERKPRIEIKTNKTLFHSHSKPNTILSTTNMKNLFNHDSYLKPNMISILLLMVESSVWIHTNGIRHVDNGKEG